MEGYLVDKLVGAVGLVIPAVGEGGYRGGMTGEGNDLGTFDLPCVGCGYNLRMQAEGGYRVLSVVADAIMRYCSRCGEWPLQIEVQFMGEEIQLGSTDGIASFEGSDFAKDVTGLRQVVSNR